MPGCWGGAQAAPAARREPAQQGAREQAGRRGLGGLGPSPCLPPGAALAQPEHCPARRAGGRRTGKRDGSLLGGEVELARHVVQRVGGGGPPDERVGPLVLVLVLDLPGGAATCGGRGAGRAAVCVCVWGGHSRVGTRWAGRMDRRARRSGWRVMARHALARVAALAQGRAQGPRLRWLAGGGSGRRRGRNGLQFVGAPDEAAPAPPPFLLTQRGLRHALLAGGAGGTVDGDLAPRLQRGQAAHNADLHGGKGRGVREG